MGGRLGVESEPGEGSLFWFTVPMPVGWPGDEVSESEPIAEARLQGVRVLLAEDNPVNRKVAVAMLGRLGVEPDVAEDGSEALEALSRQRYDLVLMDCQMPGIDGYEAVRRLRRGESGVLEPDVPVIALTAHALTGDRERSLEAGMDDHLPKPLDLEALERSMCSVLRDRCPETRSTSEPSPVG